MTAPWPCRLLRHPGSSFPLGLDGFAPLPLPPPSPRPAPHLHPPHRTLHSTPRCRPLPSQGEASCPLASAPDLPPRSTHSPAWTRLTPT